MRVFHKLKNKTIMIILVIILVSFIPNSLVLSEGKTRETTYSLNEDALYPTLTFSTYFGNEKFEEGRSIAVNDDDGSFVVTGYTSSSDFQTLNAYNSTYGGGIDAFIAKFSSNGLLLWSTFFGGSAIELGNGIAVSDDGSCYVTGQTESANFPTLNAYNSTFGGGYGDAFIAKFSASGTLMWSTFFGGSAFEVGNGIAVSDDGSCYVTGKTGSANFPMLNAYDDTLGINGDAFVAKFTTTGSLLWSTYLGGQDSDYGYEIAVASDGSCYTTGYTESGDFPTMNAYNSTYAGGAPQTIGDSFVTKFSTIGSLIWSTFLGGNGRDYGYGIAVSSDNSCFVTGQAGSSNFPMLNAYNSTYGGGHDAFVSKFSTLGELLWSTYLGGKGDDIGRGIAVTSSGSCYVTGHTRSSDFPYQYVFDGGGGLAWASGFVTKLTAGGDQTWSTCIGGTYIDYTLGIDVTSDEKCYVTGWTYSDDYPVVNEYDDTLSGGQDAYITIIGETTTSPVTTEESSRNTNSGSCCKKEKRIA